MELTHVQHRFLQFCIFSDRVDDWFPSGGNLLPQRTANALVEKGILEAVEGQDKIYQLTPVGMKLARDLKIKNH